MAINYETILSSYDDRLTLLEFMNRVLDALENASVDATHFSSLGNGQYTFSIDFADGSSVESAPVTINGAKGVSSFSASNGVLTIGLTDGSTLTANPFNGNISISGDLQVNGDHIDLNGAVTITDQDGLDVTGPLSVSGDASVGGNLHVVTQLDVDDESDFAGHVEMHNGLHIINTDLTVDGNAGVGGDLKTDVIRPLTNSLANLSWQIVTDQTNVILTPDYGNIFYLGGAVFYRFRGNIKFTSTPSPGIELLYSDVPFVITGTDYENSHGVILHSGKIALIDPVDYTDPEYLNYVVYYDDGHIVVELNSDLGNISYAQNKDYGIDISFTLFNREGQSFN